MLADYSCKKCKIQFEYRKNIGESFPETPKCPLCNETQTSRIWTPPVISCSEGSLLGGADYLPSPFTPIKHIPGGLPDNPDTI